MVNISFAKTEHIDLISEFEKEYFNSEAYSKETILDIMKDNYILKNNTNIFVITDNEELVGYIIFHISDDFTDIYKIFIRDKDRRSGYGHLLIEQILNLCKRYNSKKIMVEVRKNNIFAINFYEKNNFKLISERLNYYNDPKDDALIYERIVE